MEKSAKHVFQQIQPISQFLRGAPNRWELTEKSCIYSSSFIIIIIIYFVFIEAVSVILKQSSVAVLQEPNIIPVSTTEDFLPSSSFPLPILRYLV